MRDVDRFKSQYFIAKLAPAEEPITEATRFQYFLFASWGNPESYEIERKANKRAEKIAALLSERDNTNYKLVKLDALSDTAYTVLKDHFPAYELIGKALVSYDILDSTADKGAKQASES